MQQYNGAGNPVTPNIPWLVDNVNQGFSTEAISETLNLVEYEKDASGSTVIVPLTSRRIFDRKGGKLASYWGDQANIQYETTPDNTISGVVLTDGSAAVAISDSFDLEKIFESATKGRYVLKITDRAGKSYYGWIGGVAASSGVYTFDIYSEVGLSNQNWVKTWGTGIAAPYEKVEIFEYATSVEFASANTFTEELPYSEYASDFNQIKNLTDGQYRIDYRRGRLLGRKANADNTEDVTYIGLKSGGDTGDVNVKEWGGTSTSLGTKTASASVPVTLASDQIGQIGGGGAGGGNNTYSTEQGDFTATVTDATNNIVLSVDSIGGNAITASNFANGVLQVYDASTEEMVKISLDDFTWTSATKTLDTTNCTGAFAFATDDIVSLTLVGADKTYNSGFDATKNLPLRDVSDQHASDTLATVTNETDATSYYYLDVEGYSEVVVQFEKTGGSDTVAVTIEASAQNDNTVDSSCTYQDITQYGTDCLTAAAGASFADDVMFRVPCKGLKFIRVKVAVTISASDLDYTIFAGRAY